MMKKLVERRYANIATKKISYLFYAQTRNLLWVNYRTAY